jgi:hypothetical protein
MLKYCLESFIKIHVKLVHSEKDCFFKFYYQNWPTPLAQFAVGKKSTKACNLGVSNPVDAGKGRNGQKVFSKKLILFIHVNAA